MKEVVIVGAIRSPIGTFGGSLRDIQAIELSRFIIESVIKRTGLEKSRSIRSLWATASIPQRRILHGSGLVKAGLPIETLGFHIIATCGSAMQAIICGVQSIKDAAADVIIAGGVESMSTAPYLLQDARWGFRLQHHIAADIVWMSMQEHPIGGGMGMTAENLAEQYGISREEQDLFSLRSQRCAGRAIKRRRLTG